ncbi:MAG: Lipoprotein signal peptidase [uncultured Nocardioidaceae bacterium]|uniref:Lipoprotein signal peptidase n=1 Tax=uncultured Nocardioidaceae bacterium TaxID=253824 RepID=A0A6J4MKP3_9ACTN|nr:MAG: Lipoprotein signal peptidase [uncultured Nocardioidaceae bacterium]
MQAEGGASLSHGDADQRTSRRPLGIFFGVAATAYLLDIGTKVLAVDRLEGEPPVPVIGEVLQLTLVRNPGAAFSTGTSYTLVLSLVAVAAVVVVLFLARRLNDRLWAVGLGCLLGGVLGNLTDRIFREPGFLRGHVIDFLQLPNWPVFNIADMCINAAAVVIILQAFRGVSHTGERSSDEQASERP